MLRALAAVIEASHDRLHVVYELGSTSALSLV